MENKILNVIFSTIDELNEQREKDKIIPKEKNTLLFGEDGLLDSLALVSLVSILEEKLEDDLDLELTLVSEEALSLENSPFASIESLNKYVTELSTH